MRLRAVARGLSNQAIARELWVTEQTVKFHLHNVYRKLGEEPNGSRALRVRARPCGQRRRPCARAHVSRPIRAF